MLNHRRSFLLFMPAVVFLVATILSGIILSSTSVSAEDTIISNVDISVPVSCNINSSVDVAHTAIVNAGTSVPDIGTTNFTVFCNDASGFALYAIGYTNEDYGDNTLVGQNLNGIINTGTATSGNNSAWAMKMVKVTDGSYQPNNLTVTNSFNDYHNVPDTYTKVAQYTASTDFTLGSKLQSTYRAFISTYQDADTYNGKVKYTLVHPYDAAPCNPIGTTISTIVCMQDIKSTNKASVLSSMTTNTQYQLKDSRDEKIYYVAKLADGNIWMTQNLDLDLDSSKTYTSTDTDLSINTTWKPDRSTYSYLSNFWCDGGRSSRGECTENYTPESIDLGNRYWNGEEISEYNCGNDLYDYEECVVSKTASSGDAHYHIGNFYNYTAIYASNDTSNYDDSEPLVTIEHSICPAGWKLPSSTDYNSLIESDYYSSLFSTPIFLNPFGYFDGEPGFISYPSIGYKARYGTSNYRFGSGQYLQFSSTDVSSDYRILGRGVTIRCVAK